jgi:hypothetical protein
MTSKRKLCVGLIAVVFFVCSIRAVAKNDSHEPSLTGVVVDKAEQAPIARVHIWIHEDTGKESFTALTDQSGHFAIRLPPGYYDVLFSSTGFSPYCKKIWVHSDKLIKLDVRMEPDDDTNMVD